MMIRMMTIPIEVTLVGIITDVNPAQQKALAPNNEYQVYRNNQYDDDDYDSFGVIIKTDDNK